MEQLSDGVYFDLPEDVYFAQDRLGSSDLSKLSTQGFGWWWQSRHNPRRVSVPSPYQNFGRALHKLLLEGATAFARDFAVAPDPATYRRVLKTVKDCQDALEAAGQMPLKKSGLLAADWHDLCRLHLPADVVVWDNVMADFDKLRGARAAISADDGALLKIMHQMILDDDTPAGEQIRQVIGVGSEWPLMTEISFLWHDDKGVARRARFDRLTPNYTLDMKSLTNWKGKPVDQHAVDQIKSFNYSVQVGDQHIARMIMTDLIAAKGGDAIIGGTTEQRAFLIAMSQKRVPFEWVWLFYQVPSNAGSAPIVLPIWEDWKGPHHLAGHRKAVKARDKYLEGVRRFGLDRPWGEVLPLHYTAEGRPTSIPLSHWGLADHDPVEGEDILDR